MVRCLIVTVVCWLGMAVWLSCDCLARPEKDTFDRLEIGLCFVYALCPLVPAAGAAIFSGTRMSMRWWLRGILAAAVSSGIVALFFMQTRNREMEIQQIEIIGPLISAMAGFLIGISAPRTEGHIDNPLLH